MSEEQSAAYVIAMACCAFIKAHGMIVENHECDRRGEAAAYRKDDFDALISEFGIHNNGVLGTFRPWT